MLCKMVQVARNQKPGSVPMYLNIYDLSHINGYAYWLGLGIYHSGVQVHGVEYGFGAHDHATTGIFEVEPRSCPGFTFRKSSLIGISDLGHREVRAFMEKIAKEYSGNTYNLITKNRNHLYNDVCLRLTQKRIPRWVNRLARLVELWDLSYLPDSFVPHSTILETVPILELLPKLCLVNGYLSNYIGHDASAWLLYARTSLQLCTTRRTE